MATNIFLKLLYLFEQTKLYKLVTYTKDNKFNIIFKKYFVFVAYIYFYVIQKKREEILFLIIQIQICYMLHMLHTHVTYKEVATHICTIITALTLHFQY